MKMKPGTMLQRVCRVQEHQGARCGFFGKHRSGRDRAQRQRWCTAVQALPRLLPLSRGAADLTHGFRDPSGFQ